jgi:hypothetical protein
MASAPDIYQNKRQHGMNEFLSPKNGRYDKDRVCRVEECEKEANSQNELSTARGAGLSVSCKVFLFSSST